MPSGRGLPWPSRPLPRSWTAVISQQYVSQEKSLGRSILLEQPSLASATWSKIRSMWKFISFPVASAEFMFCAWKSFLVLGKRRLCLSRLGMRCFSTADSDSPSAFNSRFSQKGARGPKTTTPESILDSTWKVSEAIFNSRRHILKRRSGISFPILFNCGSEVENGVKSIAMRRSSRFIFKCCHTWPGCGGLNWWKGVEKA